MTLRGVFNFDKNEKIIDMVDADTDIVVLDFTHIWEYEAVFFSNYEDLIVTLKEDMGTNVKLVGIDTAEFMDNSIMGKYKWAMECILDKEFSMMDLDVIPTGIDLGEEEN